MQSSSVDKATDELYVLVEKEKFLAIGMNSRQKSGEKSYDRYI